MSHTVFLHCITVILLSAQSRETVHCLWLKTSFCLYKVTSKLKYLKSDSYPSPLSSPLLPSPLPSLPSPVPGLCRQDNGDRTVWFVVINKQDVDFWMKQWSRQHLANCMCFQWRNVKGQWTSRAQTQRELRTCVPPSAEYHNMTTSPQNPGNQLNQANILVIVRLPPHQLTNWCAGLVKTMLVNTSERLTRSASIVPVVQTWSEI